MKILIAVTVACWAALGPLRSACAEIIPEGTDFGVYPNCLAPAIGVESQSWWDEKASPLPEFDNGDVPASQRLMSKFRHVHMGMCVPNARTVDGNELTLSGVYDFTAALMLHNNPGEIGWVNMGVFHGDESRVFVRDHPSLEWREQRGRCTGSALSCVHFDPGLSCPQGQTCRFVIPMRVHIKAGSQQGLDEMRMKPNLSGIPPRDDRQFTTNNFQIHVGGNGHYRSHTGPIGRGWYTGLEYANASIQNYMDLFNGRTDITMPILSGTVDLEVNHAKGDGSNVRSFLRINPDAHQDLPGILLYDKPGNFSGTVQLDTTPLPEGRNVLFIATSEDNDKGTLVGILKHFICVDNALPSEDCGVVPPPQVRGDLDGDGQVMLADLKMLIQMLAGLLPADLARANLDGDGTLSLADVRELIRLVVQP